MRTIRIKNLSINVDKLVSLVLAGIMSFSLQGCGNTDKNDNAETNTNVEQEIVIQNNNNLYVDRTGYTVDLTELNNNKYITVEGNNRYTILPNNSIYYTDGTDITYEEIVHDSFVVNVIETNEGYSYVLFPNNTKGYVRNAALIKCANLTNGGYVAVDCTDDKLANNAYLYNENGSYIGYLYENQDCNALATNGEYTLIVLPDGRQGYVLNKSLTNCYRQINGYGCLKSGKVAYRDTNFTSAAYNVSEDLVVEVLSINPKYVTIFDHDINDIFYVRTADLDSDFIIIHLDSQRMDCYLDYVIAESYPIRSGNDNTPTHTGSFDIDWQAKDFTFPKHPNLHADYITAYNEVDEECIHDLDGDDWQNYGTQGYHQYGGLGCPRTTDEGSEFVYENYEPGDMVFVRKK